jgi:hypothetical protein
MPELILTMLPQGEGAVVAGGNALDVVVRILNNQLSSLVWIDDKVSRLFVCVLKETILYFKTHSVHELHVKKLRRMKVGWSKLNARTKLSGRICLHSGC